MSNTAHRIFHKSIKLMEERIRAKVRHAVLLIETDYGDYTYEFGKDENEATTLLLANRFVAEKATKMFIQRYKTAHLVMCQTCAGSGEVLRDGYILTACSRCKGGGQVVLTVQHTEDETNKQQIRPEND